MMRRAPHAARGAGSFRGLLLFAALAALLLQSLAPPGYMPGSLSSGWPVVLCPEGLPAGFLGHAHYHHHTDSDAGADTGHQDQGLGGHCPLGGMLDTVALSSSVAVGGSEPPAQVVLVTGYRAPALERYPSPHLARAPPVRDGSRIV